MATKQSKDALGAQGKKGTRIGAQNGCETNLIRSAASAGAQCS